MTRRPGSPESPAEVGRLPLVLGLGNPLLGDDGVGLEVLSALQSERAGGDAVELVDGGTQGLALLGVIAGRPAMVVLDAVACGGRPGTVYEMTGGEALALRLSGLGTAHEGGAGALLATLQLTGDLPPWVRVVGVEPEELATGLGLSARVAAALPLALARARAAVADLLAACAEGAAARLGAEAAAR